MRKKPFDPFKNLKLDPYEQEIENALEERDFRPAKNKALREKYARIARYTLKLMKKDKRLSIRMNESDLNKIQSKAQENGLHYQTLITTILHQYASGKIILTL